MTIRYFEQYTSGWKREVDGSGVLDAWVNRRHWVGYGGSELPNESEKLERLITAVGLDGSCFAHFCDKRKHAFSFT